MGASHEEGNVLPGAPCFLLCRTTLLLEHVGVKPEPGSLLRRRLSCASSAGQLKRQTSNNENQRININSMWSHGKKKETVPMSLDPKSIFGILTSRARDLCNYAVLVEAWSHLSLTLHRSRLLQGGSSEICDSSSWLAQASAFFIPSLRLVGKFLFLAV